MSNILMFSLMTSHCHYLQQQQSLIKCSARCFFDMKRTGYLKIPFIATALAAFDIGEECLRVPRFRPMINKTKPITSNRPITIATIATIERFATAVLDFPTDSIMVVEITLITIVETAVDCCVVVLVVEGMFDVLSIDDNGTVVNSVDVVVCVVVVVAVDSGTVVNGVDVVVSVVVVVAVVEDSATSYNNEFAIKSAPSVAAFHPCGLLVDETGQKFKLCIL